MDDVDAVQAQIARNMLESGDWVTARLDRVDYLEKSPMVYWAMAISYRIFGVHDWAARLPLALCVVLLCWVTYRFGRWAFSGLAGMYAGVALATCIGLYLFTRILIPDAMVTLTITGAIWAWLRLLEPDAGNENEDEAHPRCWAAIMGLCFGVGLLLKGLIAIVFPIITGVVFMIVTRQALSLSAWRKLKPLLVFVVMILIAAPWHVLAALRNPPYFAFSMHSGPGEYRGFFWFYFFNEHLLRFLNLRYPRDYNTVPRALFWLFNLIWLFPWSAYLPAAVKLSYRADTRAARVRLIALCWISCVMVFFTFSTTQEYYSMPIYPALALLIGSALDSDSRFLRPARWIIFTISAIACAALAGVLFWVRNIPAPGDISQALSQHPELYTLSLGHMGDLTLQAFAYLKLPLLLAVIAFAVIAASLLLFRHATNQTRTVLAIAAGMIIFFQASRLALVRFDPYLGSHALAVALEKSPPGQLIEADAYYAFSSVFFYTDRTALLLNGRMNNLEYGSYAPKAPHVFIDDAGFKSRWVSAGTKPSGNAAPERFYLLTYGTDMPHMEQLVGRDHLFVVKENGGNYLLTNLPLPQLQ